MIHIFGLLINVIEVRVILNDGTDLIMVYFQGPTSYPELNTQFPNTGFENPCFNVNVQKGFGVEWVKQLGIPDELVTVIQTNPYIDGRHTNTKAS